MICTIWKHSNLCTCAHLLTCAICAADKTVK